MAQVGMARPASHRLAAILLLATSMACAPLEVRRSEAVEQNSPKVFIASDSTASRYGNDRYPQSGWGQFLGCALTSVTVVNRAIGARSTRTFIEEARWNKIRADMRAGDTVLIQFAHNDANQEKSGRFAASATTYRQNLISFVADVKALKGTPILLTPVARRSFNGGATKADFADYSAVVREVADTFDVAMIDLETASRTLIDNIGVEESKMIFLHYAPGMHPAFPDGITDNTHFSELGARRIASLVADGLSKLDVPIANSIKSDRSMLDIDAPLGHRKCQ